MTMDHERWDSINWTRSFLRDLLDPQKTPRVPRAIRIQAARLLRHYPEETWVAELRAKVRSYAG